MIVVDTSALVAVARNEPEAARCEAALIGAALIAISAGTFAEAMIVSRRRGFGAAIEELVRGFAIEVVPVTSARARRVADAHDVWGKGIDPAALNFGDCFAYALAKERACPLLFVGGDFSRTDIAAAT